MITSIESPVISGAERRHTIQLPYVEQGAKSGIPVVFLHGYSDSWRSFERVLPYLPASIRALVVTQRGHGDASRPATGYQPEDFAADVVAFLDALEIESAVIVGHSMGSIIAQRCALDYPERVRKLVLVGAFLGLQKNGSVHELRDAVAQLTDPIDVDFVREFQLSTLAQPVPHFETVVQESLKMPARVWKEVLANLLPVDYSAEIGQIKAPTCIIWGDQDSFSPRRDQEALAAGIANARLIEYAGTGHSPHWEDPQRFVADLVTFIQR